MSDRRERRQGASTASKRRPLTEVMRSADGRSEPPRKAIVGNLIAADVETVPDLAERHGLGSGK